MTDAVSQETLRLLERAIPVVRASQYMTLSGCSLLLYDYFLTLNQEIELIWKAPLSTITLIFLVNRYTIPLILAVDIYDRLGLANPPSVAVCKVWVWLEGYLTVASFMSMHALVAMRVHALFGGGKRVKMMLWAAWIVYAVLTLILLSVGLSHGQSSLTVEPYFNTCYEEISSILWTVWLPSIFLESLMFTMTTLKAIREARQNLYHPISSILYRDGILYFLAISVATFFSMFVWLLGSAEYEGLAKYWATAVVNVAGSRLVLSLKTNARALQSSRAQTAVGQSSSFVIGTMGTYFDRPLSDSCGFSDDCLIQSDDEMMMYELPQLGSVYPEATQTHWEAI
ncbi:uncharacterized protein FOMMEDRAFT_17066 [Fomitiporia mediterranea MF3/22]|uniref:uncharacterized protein n=1 Tax=Fomitiporia mediterranea (strain MF3/22) TaxID=694068 RepID=UPI0004408C9E|nr:uncharacterized protein FOMMEDRAFT_17066 [Fomitiporia mediterranea MF3/22]EJD06542.1 hypothetical protein FOMMEDRAFT_17066 [Fomitiporia mediterranea MF3/22]